MAFVTRLKPNDTLCCVLFGKPVEVKVHWVDGQSLPCRHPGCEHCPAESKLKLYYPAWMQIDDWNSGVKRYGLTVLELNPLNRLEIERMPYPVVVIAKRGAGKRSAVSVKPTFMEAMLPEDRPPLGCFVDVSATLRKWDGWEQFDKPNFKIVAS